MKTRNVTLQKLRKLAERAIQVVQRSGHLDQTIALSGASLVTSAQAFIANYDASRAFAPKQASEMESGRVALSSLQVRLRAWVAMLAQDIPGFDAAKFDGAITEPEYLLADAKRVLDIVQAQVTPMPYSAELTADLTAAIEKARTQWGAARSAIVELQRLRAVTRSDASSLQGRLVAFRRTIRALLGTHHQDFQTLRASRVLPEEDEVLEADEGSQPVLAVVTPSAPVEAGTQANGIQPNGFGASA